MRTKSREGPFHDPYTSFIGHSPFEAERFFSSYGETEVLVKWLGWPDRFNEWIPKENITRDYEKEGKG